MNVSSVNSSSTNLNGALGGNNQVMSKDDFLQMFVSTLKYQDPLNPMSNEEFAAQLANFSQLEQLQNMNSNLETMVNSNMIMTQSINNSLAATFIGKDIKTINPDFNYKMDDGDKELNFTLNGNSALIKVNIYNENGELIRTIEKANLESGDGKVNWDGRTDSGSNAGDGKYSFEIKAYDENGDEVSASIFQRFQINGIKYVDGMANLMAGDSLIPLGQITEILNPETNP